MPDSEEVVRTFDTGANRDVETGKLDPEGFFSPLVIKRFAEYMDKNRHLRDGSVRDSDNWQKGIPQTVYAKSLWRHVLDFWLLHRGYPGIATNDIQEALCGVMFNAMGYLFEQLKFDDTPFLDDVEPVESESGDDSLPIPPESAQAPVTNRCYCNGDQEGHDPHLARYDATDGLMHQYTWVGGWRTGERVETGVTFPAGETTDPAPAPMPWELDGGSNET